MLAQRRIPALAVLLVLVMIGLFTLAGPASASAAGHRPSGAHRAAARPKPEPTLHPSRRPRVVGVQRFFHTVRADVGHWPHHPELSVRWLRDGQAIRGAHGRRYTFAPQDVGHRVRLEVVARRDGYRTGRSDSPVAGPVRNRVDVHRTVRYSVATRGHLHASVAQFRRIAQATYDDPRGWIAMGVRFVRVAHGGAFTLWLAQASTVPGFSSACSAQYSCRVGRNVIINENRWQHSSPTWHSQHGSLLDYRHLVVNHETGHWLGYGHRHCPGPGQLAPVMQQQSKGLHGCRINPWPTLAELNR